MASAKAIIGASARRLIEASELTLARLPQRRLQSGAGDDERVPIVIIHLGSRFPAVSARVRRTGRTSWRTAASRGPVARCEIQRRSTRAVSIRRDSQRDGGEGAFGATPASDSLYSRSS
jgi:hypothetical protein